MQPFSITLFATTGDPEGIRHLDKSNWSGYGVVFNKELLTCRVFSDHGLVESGPRVG